MQITNGSVTRVYRPADFEGRTVTLAFAFDPGDDVEAGIAKAVEMAERHARQVSARVEVTNVTSASEPAPVQKTVRARSKPPVVETKATVGPTDPAPGAESPSPEAVTDAPAQPPADEQPLSTDDAIQFFKRLEQKGIAKPRIEALRDGITGVPGMKYSNMPAEQKIQFVAEAGKLLPPGAEEEKAY